MSKKINVYMRVCNSHMEMFIQVDQITFAEVVLFKSNTRTQSHTIRINSWSKNMFWVANWVLL